MQVVRRGVLPVSLMLIATRRGLTLITLPLLVWLVICLVESVQYQPGIFKLRTIFIRPLLT